MDFLNVCFLKVGWGLRRIHWSLWMIMTIGENINGFSFFLFLLGMVFSFFGRCISGGMKKGKALEGSRCYLQGRVEGGQALGRIVWMLISLIDEGW